MGAAWYSVDAPHSTMAVAQGVGKFLIAALFTGCGVHRAMVPEVQQQFPQRLRSVAVLVPVLMLVRMVMLVPVVVARWRRVGLAIAQHRRFHQLAHRVFVQGHVPGQ